MKHWERLFKVVLLILIIVALSLGVLSFTDAQIPGSLFGGKELSSPGDWITEEQIKVYPQRIILDVEGASWASFTNTNSMDPYFDETAHAIEVKPADPEQINVGDIISYKTVYGILVHRVIEVGEDKDGIYYFVKGDNNRLTDPFKVRFEDVQGVVVAIIY